MSAWEGLNPPYSTIVADPPWSYEGRTPPWCSGSTPSYALMPLADIKTLPVESLAARDAHLYLWATLPLMADAYEVVKAWGFQPDTVLTWCKQGPGLGAGWRGNTEHLIVARRGFSYINPTCDTCGGRARGAKKCACLVPLWRHKGERVLRPPMRPFQTSAEGTWYVAPRGEHSSKPPLFADLIEHMSPGPYVELFARQPRLGWDHWGHGYEMGGAAWPTPTVTVEHVSTAHSGLGTTPRYRCDCGQLFPDAGAANQAAPAVGRSPSCQTGMSPPNSPSMRSPNESCPVHRRRQDRPAPDG